MYEFYIESIYTGEERIVYGYDTKNAFRRAKLNPAEWVVYSREYID